MVRAMRIRGNGNLVLAERSGTTWTDPYGGTFTATELEHFDAFAQGQRETLTIGRGTRWEQVHEAPRLEVLF